MNSKMWCPLVVMTLAILLPACGLYPSAETRVARAADKFALGDYLAAESELLAVVKRDARHAAALSALARVEFRLGRLEQAQGYLTRALNSGGPSATLRELSAEILLAQGKFGELLKLLTADSTPADAHKLALQAAAYTGLKNFAQADAALAEAQKFAAGDPIVLLRQAELRMAQGQVAAAQEALDKSLAADPTLMRARILRGSAALSQGNSDRAREAFQSVVDAKPGLASSTEKLQGLVGMAEIFLAKNDLKNAADIGNRLRALAPGSFLAHFFQGRIALQGGDSSQAVNELTAATHLAPGDVSAETLLGAALLAQGSKEQAISILSSVLTKHPDSGYARKLLAQAQLANNQADDARKTLAGAGDSVTLDAQADYLMAAALMKAGDIASGIPYLEKSAAAARDNLSVQIELARAYLMTGEFVKARTILEKIPAAKRDNRVQSLSVLARIAGQSGPQALATLDELASANSTDGELVAIVGTYALKLGSLDTAERYFAQSLRQGPTIIVARLGAAEVAAAKLDYKSAEAHLLAVLKSDPRHQQALLMLADLAQRQGKIAVARDWLEKAISADPATSAARLALAQLEFRDKNTVKANRLLDQAIAVAVDKSAAANAAGEVAIASGQNEEALGRFTAAVKLGSKPAKMNLARVQIALSRSADARQTLASMTEPGYSQAAAAMLVGLDARDGKFDLARERIATLRRTGLAPAAAFEMEGDVSVLAKQLQAAIRFYNQAYDSAPSRALTVKLFQVELASQAKNAESVLQRWLTNNPNDLQIRFMYASQLQQLGQHKAAVAQYEALLKATPGVSASVLNNLALAYHELGDQRALETARQAYEKDASRAEIADTYGWLLIDSGDAARGKPIVALAATKAPKNPAIRYHLAVAKARTALEREAIVDLKQLLADTPQFDERPVAEKFLQTLIKGTSR